MWVPKLGSPAQVRPHCRGQSNQEINGLPQSLSITGRPNLGRLSRRFCGKVIFMFIIKCGAVMNSAFINEEERALTRNDCSGWLQVPARHIIVTSNPDIPFQFGRRVQGRRKFDETPKLPGL